jgi:DNA-directed DNA polymerase III PolC
VHLHLHSNYSFLAGTLSIERIIAHGKVRGATALALTDTNNVSGVMEFYTSCLRAGIKPIPGAEFRLAGQRAAVLALSWDGYARICAALTTLAAFAPPARILEGNEESTRIDADDADPGPGRSDALASILATHLDDSTVVLSSNVDLLRSLRGQCDASLYVELIKAQEARWPTLLDCAKGLSLPLIATNDVYFGEAGGRRLHQALRAIATNTTLGTLPQEELAPAECWFIGEAEFRQWFRHVPQALDSRDDVIASVHVQFDTESTKFTNYPDLPDAQKAMRLRSLTEDGLRFRYPSNAAEAQRRIDKELDIIRALGFVDYFLVAWDLIRYARFRGYPYVGRGSGANSIVAYCLQITNVDPIELDLFFERFLNPERKSPPDFDIDFSWRNRDELIAYALSKYGSERTAMICTISTFNPRGALREVGKVLGFSAAEIKQVTAMLPGYGSAHDFSDENSPFRRHMGPVLHSPYGKEWARYAKALLDFPNHYGIHSGGVILAPEVMTRYTATQIAPKGVRITQQDMYSLEDWRLEKLDILSIRGLGTFEDTMLEVKRRSGVLPPIQDYKIACGDAKTREIMRKGETVGCFYVESPAMIQLLKKLRTDTFEMLTAASSIIRPGVAQSGMMQAFIERFHDRSKIDPPHPAMAELLKSTYGVMVYQEDVIKVAHFIGKLSLGEADLLRRAMSGKMRSREAMRALKHTFFIGCARQGITEDVSAEIWRQMESFAGYSFCKAHSASYAVLSFQEAWLKAHYPALFLCAVLNNQGGYYRPEVYIQEARRLGLAILLPDVNASDQLHTCPNDRTIQLGFLHIKGLTERTQETLLRERRENGRYTSFEDFLDRSGATYEDVCTLVRCGACDTLEDKRGAMLVKTKLYFNRQGKNAATQSLQLALPGFDAELQRLKDYSPEQIAQIELETFTYTVSTHILSHFSEQLRGTVTATELDRYVGRRVSVGGWMIAAKLSRTKKGERMMFVNLDDSTGRIDVVLFPKCFDAHAHLLRTAGPFVITGRVKKEYEVVTLIGESVKLLTQS